MYEVRSHQPLTYEVKIGKLKKGEVDFVVSNGNTLAYVQVTYLMADPLTKEREFQSLLAIRDGYKKVILSMDPINMSQKRNREYFHYGFPASEKEYFLIQDSFLLQSDNVYEVRIISRLRYTRQQQRFVPISALRFFCTSVVSFR